MGNFESSVLIQLIQTLNGNIEIMKEAQRSTNSTLALAVEQLINLRNEINERERDTLVARTFRTSVEIQALEAKDAEYAIEMEKVRNAQEQVQAQLEAIKTSRGGTQEKIRTIVDDALKVDKIDIKGIKIPSRFVPYLLIAVVIILALLILFSPNSIADILSGLALWIGGAPK